jgi:2-polyprenyl-3-methyl-5-hydroxy-6-metoxy-1,4-benzoquinol methylase
MTGDFTEFEELRSCPVCRAPGPFSAVFERVARCPACRVYFANPRPTQAEIAASYESGATYDSWIPERAAREAHWKIRLALIDGPAHGRTLLDVGVGDGQFLTVARAAGFACLGTELSQNGANRARAEGHEVRVGQLNEIDLGGREFDVVTMWHVLEHVPNPGETLDQIWKALRPGGQFLVAVPNEDNAFVNYRLGFRKGQAAPILPPTWGHEIHLTYFQPSTLRGALRRAGFRVERMGVDDVYLNRTSRNLAVLAAQKGLNALFGWHFSMAMFASCRKDRP